MAADGKLDGKYEILRELETTDARRVLEDPVLGRLLSQNGRALYLRHLSFKDFFSSVANVHRRHFGVSGQLAPSPASAKSA